MYAEAKTEVSRSQRSAGATNQTKPKSIEKLSTALNSAKNKGLVSLKVGGKVTAASKTERASGYLTTQHKAGSGSTGFKNLSAHLLENPNPISVVINNGDCAVR